MTTNLDLLAKGDENTENYVSSLDLDETDDDEDNAPAPKKKKAAHSIAYKYFEEERIVFVSLDLETGGDRCGILQLSAEFCSPDGTRLGGELLEGVARRGSYAQRS
jgi:phosphoribosylaminoimidazole-succinocarboxamide synthase